MNVMKNFKLKSEGILYIEIFNVKDTEALAKEEILNWIIQSWNKYNLENACKTIKLKSI